jgi:S-adenosylmethionine hydrolase
MPIITLTSDFGVKDPYVAQMKATILSICPSAVLVDVTHGVDKFDVRAGAFMLASAAPYFPDGAIHLAVVDPRVGTNRRPSSSKRSIHFLWVPTMACWF